MALFPKRQAPKPEAARSTLTGSELEAVILMARERLYREGPAMRTLERMFIALDPDESADPVVPRLSKVSPPVSAEELDVAIEEVEPELGAFAVSVLKRARSLIAGAEQVTETAEPAEYVTRQELDAAIEAIGVALGCAAHEFSQVNFSTGALIRDLSATADASAAAVRPFVRKILTGIEGFREPVSRELTATERFHERMRRNNGC